MDLPYFYEEQIMQPLHILSEETSKHCVQVLRMRTGDKMLLTNGKGNLFTATISNEHKKYCEVTIEADSFKARPENNVSIAISLLKNPSRLEWFMEKATEIGVAEIIPLICDYTEKENFRFYRMYNILIAAMLQSEQTWLPVLQQPKKFNTLINEEFDGMKLIAHCAEKEKKLITAITSSQIKKLVLIGPEGDFSTTEINTAIEKKFIPVTLGNTRLRTETAGIVAVSLLINIASAAT